MEAQTPAGKLLQLSWQEIMVAQIKVMEAVAESAFISKEATECPAGRDMGYERKTDF